MTELEKSKTASLLNEPMPTQKPAGWRRFVKAEWMRPRSSQPPARTALWLTLIALALSVTGCATSGTPSDFTPRNPSPPQLSQSPPIKTYSESASANISRWRKSLTDTLTMQ